MAIKAIVLDLDGTLLTSTGVISPNTKEALIQALRSGISVFLASGRPTPSVVGTAEALELDRHNGYIITFNGAHVMNFSTKETVFQQTMSVEDSKEVLKFLENYNVVPMICIDDRMYVKDVFSGFIHHQGIVKNILEFESRIGNYKLTEVDNLADSLKDELYKILITGEPDYLDANMDVLTQPFIESKTMSRSADYFVEYTDHGVDKAKALDKVLNKLNIHQNEVIAFGDGMNDATLLEYAGIGVAMANANPSLLPFADYITDSNDEDGIVSALKHFNII